MKVSFLDVSKSSSDCLLLEGKRGRKGNFLCVGELFKAPNNSSVRIQKPLAFYMFEGQVFYLVPPRKLLSTKPFLKDFWIPCFLPHHLYLRPSNGTGSSKTLISFIIRFHARNRLQSTAIMPWNKIICITQACLWRLAELPFALFSSVFEQKIHFATLGHVLIHWQVCEWW